MKALVCGFLLLHCVNVYSSDTQQSPVITKPSAPSWISYLFCCGCMHEYAQSLQEQQKQEDAIQALIKKHSDPKSK